MKYVVDDVASKGDVELDEYPLGIARLDRAGTVLFFNKAEERFANRRAATTVGLNYFSEVAPCRAVKDFQGRFDALVDAPDGRTERFSFTYPFWVGPKTVTISLVPSARGDDSILVVTEIEPQT